MFHPLRALPLARILLMICLASPLFAAHPVSAQDEPTKWQPLGGPSGRLTHLAAAPGGREMYAVAAGSVNRQADQTQASETGVSSPSNALYASADAGATWAPLTNDLPPGEITALYVDHLGTIWLGLQMQNDLPGRRDGLWHSGDKGATWREMPLDRADLVIRTITEDASGNLLFGAVDAGGFEPGVVYRSVDRGATWTSQRVESRDSGPADRLSRLLAHPSKPGVLFVLTSGGQLLRSSDGGGSWTRPEGTGRGGGSAEMAFLAGATDTAILVQSQGASTDVLRGTDGGASWSTLPTSGWPNSALDIRSMLALPRDVLLLNTSAGTYRSADGGTRWQPLEGALSSGAVPGWAVPGSAAPGSAAQGGDGQPVLAGTDYGLFASSDAGAIWRSYGEGLPNNSGVSALLTHKDRPTLIAAALTAPGDADPPELLLTRDTGRTWLPADGGAAWNDATAWAIDPGDPDNLFVAGPDFVSATGDGAFSWNVQRVPGMRRSTVAVAPSDGKRIYIDGAPGARSNDGGQTWSEMLLGTSEASHQVLRGLAVHPADATHLWAGSESGVYESRDGGDTWQAIGLDGEAIRWLATSGGGNDGAPLTLYAGLSQGGIMRRTGDSSSWEQATNGLPVQSVIIAFAADPRIPGLLWAARDGGGVYRSTDAGDTWANMAMGMGDNLVLSLAVNYQAPGSVLAGTALAGVWTLGAAGPAPTATETPASSAPVSSEGGAGGQADRSGVDARIEVLWPHDFAPINQARLANLGIRLFVPGSLQPPACGWSPKVQLWRAVNNEPAELVELADQRSVDGQPFAYWEANDVDVSPARDGNDKIYFMTAVDGVNTATSVWAHAADARTYYPEQQVPSGIATGAVDAVDAAIQIVWPHDAQGSEASVDQASLANIAVTLFKHGTRLSVPPSWSGQVTLYGAWNSEVARPLSTQPVLGTRQSGVITYPVWEFNDIPVDRAKDGTNKLYLWAKAEGVKSYPTIWAHGLDSRTFFPAKDEPIEGCLP